MKSYPKLIPPVTLFYAYAPEDEALQRRLERHLSLLRLQGLLTDWQPREVLPGTDWAKAIDEQLRTASIILLLISPDFLASDYCYGMEMHHALARHDAGEAIVIPLLLRPTDWETAPFAHLPCLPRDRRAITTRTNRDAALVDVVKELRSLIEISISSSETHASQEMRRQLERSNRQDNKKHIPFMAPDLPTYFIQRDHEFEQVLTHLLDSKREHPTAKTTVLRGAGGFGKTTLAAALCHHESVRAAFDDGIYWVTLGEHPNLLGTLAKLYRALTNDTPRFVDVEEGVVRLAEKLLDKNCLVVIDDVWNIGHVRPFLRAGTRCTRLITTRLLTVATEVAAKPIIVDLMTAAEAVKVLVAGLEVPKELEPFRILARRLGEWPLLLELANSLLRAQLARGRTLESALNWVNQALNKRGVMGIARDDAELRKSSVAGTIAASLDLLNSNQRERYAALAVFAKEVDVPLSTVGALWSQDPFETGELVLQLDDLALLTFDGQYETVRLHSVVREYLATLVQDVNQLDAQLINAWGNPFALPDFFAWRWYGYHMLGAGRQKQFEGLLVDIQWLEAKLRHAEVWELLQDYELMREGGRTSEAFYQESQEPPPALVTFEQALRREAYILAEYPELLWQQLYNRLQWEDTVDRQVLEQECEHRSRPGDAPWFRLRNRVNESQALLFTLTGHEAAVNDCAFSPDGSVALSASNDHTLKVWDVRTGRVLMTLIGHSASVTACAFSPDGATILSASRDKTLILWDRRTGEKLRIFTGHENGVTACAFSPDGATILCGDGTTLKLWDARTGNQLAALEGHTDVNGINVCLFSPEGSTIVSATPFDAVILWDARNLQIRSKIYAPEDNNTIASFINLVRDCAFSPNGRTLLVACGGDLSLKLFDAYRGGKRGSIPTTHLGWPIMGVTACAFSPDGSTILSGGADSSLRLWDVQSKEERAHLQGHSAEITACTFSPDGSIILSASYDGTLKLWAVEKARNDEGFTGHTRSMTACAFSPDGVQVISVSQDETVIFWDAARARERGIQTHGLIREGVIEHCTFSPDGTTFLTCSRRDGIALWDVPTSFEPGPVTARARFSRTLGRSVDENEVFFLDRDSSGWETACSFSPDGTLILSASLDKTLKIWDVQEKEVRRTLDGHTNGVTACSFSPSGTTILSGSYDTTLKVWGTQTGEELMTLSGHHAPVRACAFSPDGALILSGSDDTTLKLWDSRTGKEVTIFAGHTGAVTDCAFSPDGSFALSCSVDGKINMWDIKMQRLLATFPLPSAITCLALHPFDPYAVCGDIGGKARFFDIINVAYGPLITSAVNDGRRLHLSCLRCHRKMNIQSTQLGSETECKHCLQRLRINTFVIKMRISS